MRFGSVVYIELGHEGFRYREVTRNTAWLDTAANGVSYPPEEIVAAFGHERLILSDVALGEKLFGKALRELCHREIVKPGVLVRLVHRFAADVAPVEFFCLLKALVNAGARRAIVWVGVN